MGTATKNWDLYVSHAEEIAREPGFQALRDRILGLASPGGSEAAVDIGAGTGLLTLPLAEQVSRVWAVDISPKMGEYLSTKAESGGYDNITIVTASAESLPLVDGVADVVVSNYCFHHLSDDGKERALAETFRVLRPGGRFAFGDMMFQVSVMSARDRGVIKDKVVTMLRRGPAGVVRLARNGARYATGRWEQPARAEWWEAALERAGFTDVSVEVLEHEGGVAFGRRPATS